MKLWIKSRTVWIGSLGAFLGIADIAVQFLNSGQLTTLCQQKSALSAGLAALTVFFRFGSQEQIYVKKPEEK